MFLSPFLEWNRSWIVFVPIWNDYWNNSVRPSSFSVQQFFAKFNTEEFPSPGPKNFKNLSSLKYYQKFHILFSKSTAFWNNSRKGTVCVHSELLQSSVTTHRGSKNKLVQTCEKKETSWTALRLLWKYIYVLYVCYIVHSDCLF